MGLDMYLSKKTYVKQWSHISPDEQFNISVTRGGKTYPGIKSERVSYVTEELMYWRKANQIHGWFTKNTEELEPDVKYSVTKVDLEVLLETCKKIMELLATAPKTTKQVVSGWDKNGEIMADVEVYDNDILQDILPPTQGFFFGSDNIDNYYKETISETIKFLEEELPNCDDDAEFEYYASW
jgi:hypothetical protein